MTEAINFFQSMFMFKSLAPTGASHAEIKLINALKREARTLSEQAAEESRNGQTAKDLAFDGSDQNKNRSFALIAVWHFERSAAKYRTASERFNEAGKIQAGKKFSSKAQTMAKRAAEAEAAVRLLSALLGQN